MAIVALWTSLGIYLVALAIESAVEMRARKKGKKSMEPYRYCRTYRCPGFHVPRTYGYTICQFCCIPLYEPSLEELANMTLPEEDALDIAATMAHGDFNRRFGVPVPIDVAVYIMQLEQRLGVRIAATSSHTSSLPVVQRQSTPPPDYKSNGGISTFEDWYRADFVRWMIRERGKFTEYFSPEELRAQESEM